MFTRMDLYDTLLFVHVLSAFFAVGALTALWGLILGTRGATAATIHTNATMTRTTSDPSAIRRIIAGSRTRAIRHGCRGTE